MVSRFQRLTTVAVAVAIAAPLSFGLDTHTPARTDMRELAAELGRVLGAGHVTMTGGRSAEEQSHDSEIVPPRPVARGPIAEEALVASMNRERVAHGLRPLTVNRALDAAAADRVEDMLRQHYFDHVSPQGTQPFVWIDRHGYNYVEAGENLATGFRTADSVVDGWMHSPAHRANVLGRDFADVGIAVTPASPKRPFAGPLVVALYGAR